MTGDFLRSQIRTLAVLLVSFAVGRLAQWGFEIDEAGLVDALAVLLAALYGGAASALQRSSLGRWPLVRWLLLAPGVPVYGAPAPVPEPEPEPAPLPAAPPELPSWAVLAQRGPATAHRLGAGGPATAPHAGPVSWPEADPLAPPLEPAPVRLGPSSADLLAAVRDGAREGARAAVERSITAGLISL